MPPSSNSEEIMNKLIVFQSKAIELEVEKRREEFTLIKDSDKEKGYVELNYELLNNEEKNIYYQVHLGIIKQIIRQILRPHSQDLITVIFSDIPGTDVQSPEFSEINPYIESCQEGQLIEILEKIHYDYLNSEYIISEKGVKKVQSKINLKEKGAVYTPINITESIVKSAIDAWKQQNSGIPTILDFGCGTGRFYLSALKFLMSKFGCSVNDAVSRYLFGIDSDPLAIAILRLHVCVLGTDYSEAYVKSVVKNIVCKDMLKVKTTSQTTLINQEGNNHEIDYPETFPAVFKNNGGFDVVVSNPPYFVLKSTGNKRGLLTRFYEWQKKKIDFEAKYFRKNKFYSYSKEGMLNYYRLSIECMLKIANPVGVLGIICPATLFGDISAKKMRTELFDKCEMKSIAYYPEKTKLFDGVSQATVIFILTKGRKTKTIVIEINGSKKEVFDLDYQLVQKSFENLEIPFITPIGWHIIERISVFDKISKIPSIRNRRGELDLTLHKKFITTDNTGYQLIRGKDIKEKDIEVEEVFYVSIDPFLKIKSVTYRENDFGKVRIAGQQVVNMDIDKRLNFVLTSPNYILGNSCNYLSVNKELPAKWLLIQLNSYLLNWRFKITSTNNHVNNYEISELPLVLTPPANYEQFSDDLSKNVLVCKTFGLSIEETKYILCNYFEEEKINRTYSQMSI